MRGFNLSRVSHFPVVKGTIVKTEGYFGSFEITIDGYAQPAPSSRDHLIFGAVRSGSISRCDLILDLSGGIPLFSAPDLRQGYFRADPANAAAVQKALFDAVKMIGEFDKPRFLTKIYRAPVRPLAVPGARAASVVLRFVLRGQSSRGRSCGY